jgi:hypothetical protein
MLGLRLGESTALANPASLVEIQPDRLTEAQTLAEVALAI